MKKTTRSCLFLFLMSAFIHGTFAQAPGVRWIKNISSTGSSNFVQGFYDAKPTSDKAIIAVGYDTSFLDTSRLFYTKQVSGRPWIVKMDSAGNKIWQNTYPAPHNSSFTSVAEAVDGGYVAAGFHLGFPDSQQVLIVKYNRNGVQQWAKLYGGTSPDYGYSIHKTATNGFIVAGATGSNNGDVSGNKGMYDVWLVRLDDNGNIIWKKTYGGSGVDYGYAVTQLPDYGFAVAGSSRSTNGDLTGNLGQYDGWVFKTDSLGNLLWQRNAGGTGTDFLMGIAAGSDGSVITTGTAEPTALITGGTKLSNNFWVLKLSSTGSPVWSKAFGGDDAEWGGSIVRTVDNAYIAAGGTRSSNGDVTSQSGMGDGWLLKIDDNGTLLWQKTFGSSGMEQVIPCFYLSEYDFIAAGTGPNRNALIARLGNSNTIKGTMYFDANSNGIKDAGELAFNNAIVTTQKGAEVLTAQPNGGQFQFDVDLGTYTTSAQPNSPYYTVVPASRNSTFSTYFNKDSFSFAVQPIPNQQDLVVHFLPLSPARPGFKAQYLLNYKNAGTTTIASGSVKLIKDNRAALSLAFPLPSTVVADTLTWNYTNLKPLDSIAIGIEFQLSPPPALNINDTLKYMAVILPVAGDITPADDTVRLRQRVQGSYDPNDKLENFAGKIPLKDVQNAAYINYMIRFQNTGNDTAFFVRVMDTLDTKLDWNSFQMIGSSHAYNLTIKDGNKLNWFFDNIKLPDSTTNLIKSNGYLAFRIKPKATLAVSDIIPNKASIYFDYNLPIVTNTTSTVVFVETTTGVREVQNNEMKLLLGPNPAIGYSLLQISGKLIGKFELRMIDNNGRIISQQTLLRNSIAETLQVPLNMQQFSSGVYYIQLQQKEKSWWQKVVVQ